MFRWVRRFTPLLADAASYARHSPGDRWFADETYAKVNGVWRHVYRADGEHGQVIDVLVPSRRDADAAVRPQWIIAVVRAAAGFPAPSMLTRRP